ncbi:VOC family protein [Candidatus Parcubacteria bacterium]|nr:VOC family protein [Candidatus Parcubacteria bacterium]
MANIQVTPFVFFEGNCKEAMTFYHGILGGSLTFRTYGEAMGDKAPEGWSDKIVHASLENGSIYLNAWDSKIANPEARKIELEISGDDEPKLREIFDKLCEEGKAKHPIEMQPWGGLSGRLFDKYGLDWIVTVKI